MGQGERALLALIGIGLFLWLVVSCGDIDVSTLVSEILDDSPSTTRRITTTTTAVLTESELLDAEFELALALFEVDPLFPLDFAKELALAVCADLDNGRSRRQIEAEVATIAVAEGLTDNTVSMLGGVMGAGVIVYCPQHQHIWQ